MRRPGVCVWTCLINREQCSEQGYMDPCVPRWPITQGPELHQEKGKEDILFSSQDAFPSRLIKCMIFIVCKRDSLWLEVSAAPRRPLCFLISSNTISPAPDTLAQCEPSFYKTTIFLRAFALSVPAASKNTFSLLASHLVSLRCLLECCLLEVLTKRTTSINFLHLMWFTFLYNLCSIGYVVLLYLFDHILCPWLVCIDSCFSSAWTLNISWNMV